MQQPPTNPALLGVRGADVAGQGAALVVPASAHLGVVNRRSWRATTTSLQAKKGVRATRARAPARPAGVGRAGVGVKRASPDNMEAEAERGVGTECAPPSKCCRQGKVQVARHGGKCGVSIGKGCDLTPTSMFIDVVLRVHM